MNSTDYAMDSIFTSSGGIIDSSSADYRMDTAVAIITSYSNSTNFSTWLGLYGAPSNYSNFTPANISIIYDLSFTNGTNGHWFYANATANSGNTITWVKINTTFGSCVQYSNSTLGFNFGVVFNCSINTPQSASVVITFNDTLGRTVNTSNLANQYPEHLPTLSLTITPDPVYLPTNLTCSGIFSDADSDTLNTSATLFNWYKNNTLIPGATTSILLSGNLSPSNQVYCVAFVTNSTWWQSNATATSQTVSVQGAPTGLYFEMMAFWGLISIILFLAAELKAENRILGMIGCISLMMLGVIVIADNVIIKTGESTITTQNQTQIGTIGLTGSTNATIKGNQTNTSINLSMVPSQTFNVTTTKTTTFGYLPVSMAYAQFKQLLGFFLVLVGLGNMVKYVFLIVRKKRT
jgi:hypothetical protein